MIIRHLKGRSSTLARAIDGPPESYETYETAAAVLRANDMLRALDYYKVRLDPQSELAVIGLRRGESAALSPWLRRCAASR